MNGGYLEKFSRNFRDFSIYDDYDETPNVPVCMNINDIPLVTMNDTDPLLVSFSTYEYSFNPDIYESSSVILPRNIAFIKRGSTGPEDSLSRHIPHWKQTRLSPDRYKDFIVKYFPDKWNLYKSFKHQEERDNLVVYLWLYLNGGVYIDSEYELMKSLEPILDSMPKADLYFMYDDERYISPKFLGSQPFCGFWMEVVDLMEKRKNHKYPSIREQIDRNTGRGLLTDVVEETMFKYELIPRNQLDPYRSCDREFSQDSCLRPSNRSQNIITSLSCSTGTSNELLYVTGAIIFVLVIMIIIALITR